MSVKARNRSISQAELKELFLYAEGRLIRNTTVGNSKAGKTVGTLNTQGYFQCSIHGTLYLVHRLIWLYHWGYTPEGDLDHIDQNPRNTRIENLREVSKSCNLRNAKIPVTNTSGVKGVHFSAVSNKWRAQIKLPGLKKYLGQSIDFVEAVALRLAAEQCVYWNTCEGFSSAQAFMNLYLEDKYEHKSKGL